MAVKDVYTRKELEGLYVKQLRPLAHAVFGKGSWISLAKSEELVSRLVGQERRDPLVSRKKPKPDEAAAAFGLLLDVLADAVVARMKQRRMKG